MPNCELCGEPMPPGEDMFTFHGYSGPCPKPPLPKPTPPRLADRLRQIAMDLPRIPAGDCREAAAELDRREARLTALEQALTALREAVLSRACVESQHCGMDDDPAMAMAAAALKG